MPKERLHPRPSCGFLITHRFQWTRHSETSKEYFFCWAKYHRKQARCTTWCKPTILPAATCCPCEVSTERKRKCGWGKEKDRSVERAITFWSLDQRTLLPHTVDGSCTYGQKHPASSRLPWRRAFGATWDVQCKYIPKQVLRLEQTSSLHVNPRLRMMHGRVRMRVCRCVTGLDVQLSH